MALTPCRECGKQVSDEARTCPHCGIDFPGQAKDEGPGTTETQGQDERVGDDQPLSFEAFKEQKIEEDQAWGYSHYRPKLEEAYRKYLGIDDTEAAIDAAPAKRKSDAPSTTPVAFVLVAAALGGIAWYIYTKPATYELIDRTAANTTASTGGKMTEAECRRDLRCWGDKYYLSAAPACERAIERRALHSAHWTDGWMEVKFPRFAWHDKSQGQVAYLGDSLQLMNGFGALTNYAYRCNYDPDSGGVLSVELYEGHQPW